MNRLIEIHDSKIGSVTSSANGRLEVEFCPAYLHKSEGVPGVDSGTGWTQIARLTLDDAMITGRLPSLPSGLWDGTLRIGNKVLKNEIPLPFEESEIELKLIFRSGEEVIITAKKAVLTLEGTAAYVEVSEGDKRTTN